MVAMHSSDLGGELEIGGCGCLGGHFYVSCPMLSHQTTVVRERVRASERDVRVVAGLVDGCSHSFITSDSIRRLGLDMLPRQPLQSPPLKLLFLFSEQIALLVRSPLSSAVPSALCTVYLKRLGPFDSTPNDRKV
jgi:hypothetical protein